MDCILVSMKRPVLDEEAYYSYHGAHGYTVQMVQIYFFPFLYTADIEVIFIKV